MSDSLISRSEDLRRLGDDGFEVAIVNSQLVISHVPYVTANRTVEYGSLVSELTLAGDVTTTPSTHVVRFAGQMPCDAEGRPLEKLVLSGDQLQVTEGITTSYMFSSKPVPPLFYTDYHDKMTTYAAALSGHAESLVPTATARTYRPIPAADDGVFEYLDTATSRSGTTAVGECLRTRSVGIIGLGGTGAYILDFLAKTPVAEIHLFDPDQFLQHNAFRAPGAASLEQLRELPLKVTYLADRYRSMHRVIIPRPVAIEENNLSLLDDMSFVFIAIDHGPAKRPIMEYLERRGIPFIDVGMGVSVEEGRVAGLVRTTLSTDRAGSRQAARARISTEDVALGEYNTNIQIAELNALNAAMAVIMYKKQLGFYADTGSEHFSTYVVDSNDNINEDGPE